MTEEPEAPKPDIDLSGQNLWGHVTFDFLKNNLHENLVSLNLTTNHVDEDSAELLSEFLKNSQTLKYLSLIQTRLIQRSANAIFSALGDSQLLEFYADDNIFTKQSCKILAQSLAKNPPLELLSLNGCDIPDRGVAAIANSLPHNTHLKHLRLESNSMFDIGAKEIGKNLPNSSLITLSVADNQIWNDGTKSIIENLENSKLESLDLSYNVVELRLLAAALHKSRITSLAISGCKVHDNQVVDFLQSISQLPLQTLMMCGFNFQNLPISWPAVKDTLWANEHYFDAFKRLLTNNKTLNDIRIGFFDLDQFFVISKILENIGKEVTFSILDFGRTEDIWLFQVPGQHFHSPTSTFQWKSPINNQNCPYIGQIIKQTTVNENGSIDTLDLSRRELPDDVIMGIVQTLRDFPLKDLKLAGNNIGPLSIDAISNYVTQVHLESLDLKGKPIREEVLIQLLTALNSPNRFPKTITIHFSSNEMNELDKHKLAVILAKIIKNKDIVAESIALTGPITVVDAIEIVQSFSSNPHLKEFYMDSDHEKKYASPAPELNAEIQHNFVDFASKLHDAVVGHESKCQIRKFHFPLFTEIYMYHDDIYNNWIETDTKINENLRSASKKKT